MSGYLPRFTKSPSDNITPERSGGLPTVDNALNIRANNPPAISGRTSSEDSLNMSRTFYAILRTVRVS